MVFSFAYNKISPLVSRASVSITPKDVVISNVSDTTFAVSWITPEKTSGVIAVEETGGTKYTAFDDRDARSTSSDAKPIMGAYATHMVTVRSAKPSTAYTIQIVSGGKFFKNGTTAYTVTTGPTLSGSGTTLEPAFGNITTPTGAAAEGAIVYLTPEGGQTLSTLVTTSGSWVIPLHLARTKDGIAYIPNEERINESITIQTQDGAATALTDTMNDNPIPAMVIGKDYDFRNIQAENAAPAPLAQAQTPASVLGESTQAPSGIVALTQPAEGAALPTNLPLVSGTGVPAHQVFLIVGMTNPYTDTVTIEADGVWKYTPKAPLSVGKQSITITTTDAQNKAVAITHLFEVLKSGTQVLGDATPSATLTPTIDTTPTPTSTLAGDPIPTTGSPLPLILLLILGIGLVSTGAFVFIK